MNDAAPKRPNAGASDPVRLLGWALLIGGGLVLAGFVVWAIWSDDETPIYVALAIFAIFGGLGLVLVSVLRQRLIERKTDKYRDVQI